MSAKPCREETCKMPVVFAKDTETGQWQVLSNSAPVWKVVGKDKDGTPLVARDTKGLVSHFVNCKNPNRFSGAKKEMPQPDLDFHDPESRRD